MKKNAFTLAEVLITLGIIGVVAAMTLPALIHKKNSKELETAFKKSYSNLYNAFNLVMNEGLPVFDSTNPVSDNTEFIKAFYSKYKKLKLISNNEKHTYSQSAKNFTKNKTMGVPQCSQYMNATNAFITPDGSAISIFQNCGYLWFTFDSNGIKKGPNALGHDIFIFFSPKNTTKLLPATVESEVICDENGENCSLNNTEETQQKCSNSSKSDINGATCAPYALSDECPWDSKKSYWECLP